jgi:S1-C subfamily serine protease
VNRITTFVVVLTLLGSICSTMCSFGIAQADETNYEQAMSAAVRQAANRVLASVVSIEVVGTSGPAQGDVEQDAPTSGVIVDSSGFILASSLVGSRPAASVLVVLPDGSRHAAQIIAKDTRRELVLLKIETDKPLTPINFDTTTARQIGQTTIAVGRYGADTSPMVSRGILSAEGRLDGIALQCDARISPALYGGPLLDLYGNVLGILVPAIAEGGAESVTDWYDSGVAFAIPTEIIAQKLDRLKSGQEIKRGLLGIVSKSPDPYETGTEIAAVRSRSPAESSGIKAGDRVLEVAGTPVRRQQEIRQVMGSYDAGDTIGVKLLRDGQPIELQVTLADSIPPLQPQRLGLVTRDGLRDESDPASMQVLVEGILPGSPADGVFQLGDQILRVRDAELKDSQTLRRLLVSAEPGQPISVVVQREGGEQTLSLTPQDIAAKLADQFPAGWEADPMLEWEIKELKLPDAANVAAYVAPKPESNLGRLGLLILLLNPGQGTPQEVLKTWSDAAKQAGVVVCAIAAEDNRRWLPKELETISKFAASLLKQDGIDPAAVAVAAPGAIAGVAAEAADVMALAVAIAQTNTFFGVAVSAQASPPAMRLRENEASAALQILLPIEVGDEPPPWSAATDRAGYPLVRGGKITPASLLQWVRLLQSI